MIYFNKLVLWPRALSEKAADVIPDFCYSNVIRFAPVSQYTRYTDVYDLVERIKNIMETKAYEKFSNKAGTVA